MHSASAWHFVWRRRCNNRMYSMEFFSERFASNPCAQGALWARQCEIWIQSREWPVSGKMAVSYEETGRAVYRLNRSAFFRNWDSISIFMWNRTRSKQSLDQSLDVATFQRLWGAVRISSISPFTRSSTAFP
jgi:hypothetical protein